MSCYILGEDVSHNSAWHKYSYLHLLGLIRLNDIQLLEKWTNYVLYLDNESEFISQLETQELWFNMKQDTSDEDS